MNRYLVFPYENRLFYMLNSFFNKMEGEITDFLTFSGWKESGSVISINNKEYQIKTFIEEISDKCNSIWIVETFHKVDFFRDILPVLIYAIDREWKVFYTRTCSKNEKSLLKALIEQNKLFLFEKEIVEEEYEGKLYDLKKPIIWVADMFPQMPMTNVLLRMFEVFQDMGYSVGYISKCKNLEMVREVDVLPDVRDLRSHDIIRILNHFFKEKEKQKDLLLVEIPGNLIEISKKIYGDFGETAFIFSKAAPPDIVICNIPFMDKVLQNKSMLLEAVLIELNISIDYLNLIPVYFDVIESEQMENFTYVSLTDEFIEQKIGENTEVYNLGSASQVEFVVSKIIRQLNSYVV